MTQLLGFQLGQRKRESGGWRREHWRSRLSRSLLGERESLRIWPTYVSVCGLEMCQSSGWQKHTNFERRTRKCSLEIQVTISNSPIADDRFLLVSQCDFRAGAAEMVSAGLAWDVLIGEVNPGRGGNLKISDLRAAAERSTSPWLFNYEYMQIQFV